MHDIGVLQIELVHRVGSQAVGHGRWSTFDEQSLNILVTKFIQQPFKRKKIGLDKSRWMAVVQYDSVRRNTALGVDDQTQGLPLARYASNRKSRIVANHRFYAYQDSITISPQLMHFR